MLIGFEGWKCYRNKTNHLIAKLSSGRSKPLCNAYGLPDFPSKEWTENNSTHQDCGTCEKINKNNLHRFVP
jgi:hypothetical protein